MSSNKKTILYICSRSFAAPSSGHEIKMYNYCRGLFEKGYEIDLFVFASNVGDELSGLPFIRNVYFASQISRIDKIRNILFKSFISSAKWPLQNSLYYSRDNNNKIRELVDKNHYSAVIVDMVRLSTYYDAISHAECLKILDMDDLLSKRYQRQIESLTDRTSIAGTYEKNLSNFTTFLLRQNWIKKLILNAEIKRISANEKQVYLNFDKIMLVSSKEANEINQSIGDNKAAGIGLGVSLEYYDSHSNVRKKENSGVFVGNLLYSANADSVRYIEREVLPLCVHRISFTVVGKNTESLINEFMDCDNMVFTGLVDDLRAEVESNQLYIGPIVYGTGIKTKFLEAMAMGMPIITNEIGAEGIDAVNGRDWIVCNTAQDIAAAIDRLLNNQDEMKQLGSNARQFAENNLGWDQIFESFKKIGL